MDPELHALWRSRNIPPMTITFLQECLQSTNARSALILHRTRAAKRKKALELKCGSEFPVSTITSQGYCFCNENIPCTLPKPKTFEHGLHYFILYTPITLTLQIAIG
ncbi:hypothetical protein M758_1G105700 [Ceratodon purpureus]|uniref:Uncharacterized protein n=1 Tax=Ceratodon purpureus TaxID=3225 RepID=A0A8T0J6T3_CERPU|nr:hypothetical protein KC19_1G118700 [Ceratodon purpureus]KAG0629461.1 hypothetical protein M758_1G105700 [Ceratodon purpureus]